MKQIYQLSPEGYLIGSDILSPTEVDGELSYVIPVNFTEFPPSPLFIKPRYFNGRWIESASDEDIEEQERSNDELSSVERMYQELTQVQLDLMIFSRMQTELMIKQLESNQKLEEILAQLKESGEDDPV